MAMIENIYPEYIRLDGGTQPRAKIDRAVCDDYGERMKAGEKFPPIDVFFDGENYWLADGFHRVQAYVLAVPGEAIECNVFQGTQQDAQWHSYSVNKAHGLRRTNEDKERAVRAALAHPAATDKSNVQIAGHCGVDEKTVRKYRGKAIASSEIPEMPIRTVIRGKSTYRQNTARIGSKGKNRHADAVSRQAAARIQQRTKSPRPMQKMTALNIPHDPVYGARALIAAFDADYLRALVGEISNHLKGFSQ
jgi:hypothetical protein